MGRLNARDRISSRTRGIHAYCLGCRAFVGTAERHAVREGNVAADRAWTVTERQRSRHHEVHESKSCVISEAFCLNDKAGAVRRRATGRRSLRPTLGVNRSGRCFQYRPSIKPQLVRYGVERPPQHTESVRNRRTHHHHNEDPDQEPDSHG